MKKLFLSIIYSTLMCSLIVSTLFAWYVNIGSSSSSLKLQAANIESTITLYKGDDYDYDGYLDRTTEKGEAVDSYSLVAKTNVKDDADKVIESYFAFEMSEVMTTYVYTWKIVVENRGDVAANVKLSIKDNVPNISCLKAFSIKVSRTDFKSFSDKVYLGAQSSFTDNYATVYSDSTAVAIGESHEYIIQLEMEKFDDLVSSSVYAASNDTNYNEYQALQGTSTGIFDFLRVELAAGQ